MKSIPFLRILLPYLLGTICLLQGISIPYLHLLFVLCFLCVCAAFLLRLPKKETHAFRNGFFSVSLYSFLFLLAFETAEVYNAKAQRSHYSSYISYEGQAMMATIADMPVATENFLKLNVLVDAIEQNGQWHYATGNILVYVKQPVPKPLNTGDHVWLSSKLSVIPAPQNPDEFDYKTFLERKNLFHAAYVAPEKVWLTEKQQANWSLGRSGIAIREYVVKVLREAGLSQEAFSICTALLVGYDDEISSGVMQSFSHSGTLHILSVSGMHTGILYVVLMLLCNLIDKHNRYPKIRCAAVIIVMLLFAAITGFSPSVMRAVLMLVLVLLGKTFSRNGNPYNTLLVSAFLLLLYNPFLLADVGFLLSYLAVGGIMYLYPLINNRWCPENRILKFCWDLSLMSVAATLFTLPVTLYYFHQFPLWFIVSNLIIIPLSTALMGAAFLLLLCCKVVFLKQCLVMLINGITTVMLRTAQLTDDPVYGYMDNIPFAAHDILFSSLFILLTLWFFVSKSYKLLAATLVCAIVWAAASALMVYRQSSETELVVFSVKRKAICLLRTGRDVYLRGDSLADGEFRRNVKPYLLRYSGIRMHQGKGDAWQVADKRIVSAGKAFRNSRQACHYLIVSHNTVPALDSLSQIKPLVIADCSNSYTFVKKLRKRCAGLGIPFYSIKEKGALVITF
jgi:competence protein ComEC